VISKIKSLRHHQGFMRYFKNTSWLFFEKILRMTVGLFVGIWVARYLGPEQFGLFSYAQSFVCLFATVATLGLNGIVVRELVKDSSRQGEIIGTVFILKLVGAFAVLLFLAIAVGFVGNDRYTNMLIFIVGSATIFQSFNVIDFYFQSKVLCKYVVYANIISLCASSVVKIVLILNEAPLIAFAWVVLFDSFVLACGFVFFYAKNNLLIKIQNLRFNKKTALSLLKDSWPLIIAGLALSTQSYIDQVMLKELIGLKDVAYYSIAFKLFAVFGFVPVIIYQTFLPAIVNFKIVSVNLYNFRMLNLYRLMFFLFVFISVPIFFLGEHSVVLLYGEPYAVAGYLFSIFGFRLLFAFMGVGRSSYLLNENMQKHSLYTLLVASILNVVLNYIFIPIYGVYGAILTTYISFTVNIFILDLFIKNTRKNVLMMLYAIFTFWKLKFDVKEIEI